jgi:hypothetical protein
MPESATAIYGASFAPQLKLVGKFAYYVSATLWQIFILAIFHRIILRT